MHLVIGGNGLIGSAVRAELGRRGIEHRCTTRRSRDPFDDPLDLRLDLLHLEEAQLPEASHVYLIAAITGFAVCEGNPEAWRANVDAPIAIARTYRDRTYRGRHFHGSPVGIVFVSSDAVEWSSSAYARQKAQAEAYMQSVDVAIVRPARVLPATAADFAGFLVDIALSSRPGVARWWPRMARAA